MPHSNDLVGILKRDAPTPYVTGDDIFLRLNNTLKHKVLVGWG